MNEEIAIKVTGVYKNFQLPQEKHKSVKSIFTSVFRSRLNSRTIVQHALSNITFEIKKGEFFGIVGRNGSGKSTMLKMLAGIYQPTKGNIGVEGKLVPFIELGVGFNPELTGRENVYLNGALLGFSKAEIDRQYKDIVEFAELERFMDQKLKNYSSGMQVRLAFSVATRAKADVLLVDEVLAVGDADFQRKCFDFFKELKANKKTVVFVTHDMGAVREYCDRAILVDKGKILIQGSPEEAAEYYTRLFTEEEQASGDEPTLADRWGNGSVTIGHVVTDKRLYTPKDAHIKVRVDCVAHQDTESPIIGILVKDMANTHLFGTNTTIKNMRLGLIKKGEKFSLDWTLPNILSDGKHILDVAVQLNDGITVCDWWNNASSFTVRNSEKTAYPISPPINVKRV